MSDAHAYSKSIFKCLKRRVNPDMVLGKEMDCGPCCLQECSEALTTLLCSLSRPILQFSDGVILTSGLGPLCFSFCLEQTNRLPLTALVPSH